MQRWRIGTPIIGALNLMATLVIGVFGWFIVRTVDTFDKHLEKIDLKFDSQETKNTSFEHRITLVQGQCCKRSINQTEDNN